MCVSEIKAKIKKFVEEREERDRYNIGGKVRPPFQACRNRKDHGVVAGRKIYKEKIK